MTRRRSRPSRPDAPGRRYERIVANIHRHFAGSAEVSENVKIMGRSGQSRQIDVALRTYVAGYEVLVIVERKDYKARVPIGKVEELIGKVEDVGAAKGILVSDSGFTKGAMARAQEHGSIELASVIDTADPTLRSRIYVAVSCEFHTCDTPDVTLQFKGGTKHVFPDKTVLYTPQQVRDTHNDLVGPYAGLIMKAGWEWYEKTAEDLPAGEHVFEKTLLHDGDRTVTGRFRIRKVIRRFVTEHLYARGPGIYDHVHKRLVAGAEAEDVRLDFDEIVRTWREVDMDYVFPNCKLFYRVIHYFKPDCVNHDPRSYEFTSLRGVIPE